MKMSKFVQFRAQRDLNGAEITVTMTTESHNYTWPSTIWQKNIPSGHNEARKGAQASKNGPQKQPRGAKMTTWRQTMEFK